MPVIEEICDSEESFRPSPPSKRPQINLSDLPSVPSTFRHDPTLSYDDADLNHSDPAGVDLDKWKADAERTLLEVRDLVRNIREKTSGDGQGMSAEEEEDASTVYFAAQFDNGTQAWVNEQSSLYAQEILRSYTPPPTSLLHALLSTHLRPLFIAHPHPNLSSTGRKRQGQSQGQNTDYYYSEQTWKDHPGVGSVLSWCVRSMQADQYESLWPLLLPPLMAFLDDYQLPYRLEGTRIVDAFLDTVPRELVRRTGVGEVFYTAMSKSTQLLSDPLTPGLLSATIPALLRLIDLTTTTTTTTRPITSGSVLGSKATKPEAERFTKLCKLLGEHIIGHVWVYASENVDVMRATTDVLPGVVGALGVGGVRYLKAIIPQLLHTLSPPTPVPSSLQISTLVALQATFRTCAPRIARWRETILAGLARAWVLLCEPAPPREKEREAGLEKEKARQTEALREKKRGRETVKAELVKTCLVLKEVCEREGGPGVKVEYDRLMGLDAGMFAGLLGRDGGVVVG